MAISSSPPWPSVPLFSHPTYRRAHTAVILNYELPADLRDARLAASLAEAWERFAWAIWREWGVEVEVD